jgi:hypothetical protein
MRKILFTVFLSVISIYSFCQQINGYKINLTINGLQDSTVFLAYHLGDKQFIKDTIKLDIAGHGIFSGKENLPQGIYMIVIPGLKYFEILMSTDQYFNLTCSYSDYFNTLKFTGSDENTAFVEYQKKWIVLQQQASALAKRTQDNKQNTDSLKILSSMQKLQEENMKAYLKSVVKDNNGNLLATLVKALLPLEVPEFSIPAGVKNSDSLKWVLSYNYNNDHFFDNIDLTDERLLRTPILYSRVNAFFTNDPIQSSDSVNKKIDRLISKCQNNYKVFQFIAVYLFNHFRESEIMGHDAVMVKLADDIYLSGKADWVTKEFKDDLKKQIDLHKTKSDWEDGTRPCNGFI